MGPKPGKKSPSRSKSPQKKEASNGEASFFGAPLDEVLIYIYLFYLKLDND